MPKKKRDKMKGKNTGENLEQAATLGNELKDAVPSKVLRSLGPFLSAVYVSAYAYLLI